MKRAIAIQFAVFLCTTWFAGCDSGLPRGWGGRGVTWSHSTPDSEGIPGIDHASLVFGEYGDGYAMVVWSGPGGSSLGACWDSARRAVHYQGQVTGSDGQRIPVECFTSDGKTGTVTISGKAFELSDGSLFLVSSAGTKTKVKQVNRIVPTLKNDTGALKTDPIKEMAKNDAEIKAFFEGLGKSP